MICDIGQGSEREKYECKDSDHAFQHDFSFGKCLLHTCVDPHKCVIGFNIFLKIYRKDEGWQETGPTLRRDV